MNGRFPIGGNWSTAGANLRILGAVITYTINEAE
jgi:hypothetical protein